LNPPIRELNGNTLFKNSKKKIPFRIYWHDFVQNYGNLENTGWKQLSVSMEMINNF
jgi:hypothetical protein